MFQTLRTRVFFFCISIKIYFMFYFWIFLKLKIEIFCNFQLLQLFFSRLCLVLVSILENPEVLWRVQSLKLIICLFFADFRLNLSLSNLHTTFTSIRVYLPDIISLQYPLSNLQSHSSYRWGVCVPDFQ